MIELSPLAVGGIGVAALLALCFAGVRFAFAGAIVGTAGLVSLIGWDAGIRTAGIAPYTAGANYTLSVLPMFILIGLPGLLRRHHPDRVRGGDDGLLAARRPRHRHGVRGRGLLGGVRREQRGAAVFAKVAIPEVRAKYDKPVAGVCAAGATLDSLIPLSTLLVVTAHHRAVGGSR
jgi:hypothetical protein